MNIFFFNSLFMYFYEASLIVFSFIAFVVFRLTIKGFSNYPRTIFVTSHRGERRGAYRRGNFGGWVIIISRLRLNVPIVRKGSSS